MNTPTADFKLRSAKFFFGKLIETRRHPRSAEFGYYLSAFLNEARSVTLALQNDAKTRYEERFETWKATLSVQDQRLLGFMNSQRVEEFHRMGTVVETRSKSVQLGFAIRAPDGNVIPIESPFGPGTAAYGLAPEHHWEIEGQSVEVLQACERYMALLGDIVDEVRR
jgi:hypothetical protein